MSDTAEAVRRGVFGPEFLTNAAGLAAPLPILLAAIVLAARFAGRPANRPDAHKGSA